MSTQRLTVSTTLRILLCSLLAMGLIGCALPYQAPVSEQSERQVITPPVIVDSASAQPRIPSTVDRSRSAETTSSPSQRTSRPGTHRVRTGETLYSIAFQHDLDFRTLAIVNDLDPPYTIFVDQVLSLDVSGINATARNTSPVVESRNGTRSRAGRSAGGVLRQPIGQQRAPSWQWPHAGSIARDFSVSGNEGIDIAGRKGDVVRAAGAGDVVYTGRGLQGVGNLIIIRHNDRYLSAYGHNRVMLVSEGNRVEAGQQIAEVGSNAAGVPMLHFEIREEGKAVDPKSLLP